MANLLMANRRNKRVKRFESKQRNEGFWHVSVWEGKVQRPGNIDAPCVNSSSALRAALRKQHVQHHVQIASTQSITRKSKMSNSVFITRTG
eukprot:scaffold144025_cov17-Tisochrysis_lutea.AAC.2